jgi:hypothetical protein
MQKLRMIILAILILPFVPVGAPRSVYISVTDPVGPGFPHHGESQDKIIRTSSRFSSVPDFVTENSNLYLRTQTMRDCLVMSPWLDFQRWPDEVIARFRKDNPELESYWPKPAEESGGIAWPHEMRKKR